MRSTLLAAKPVASFSATGSLSLLTGSFQSNAQDKETTFRRGKSPRVNDTFRGRKLHENYEGKLRALFFNGFGLNAVLHPDTHTKALDRHFLRLSNSPKRRHEILQLSMQPCPESPPSDVDSELTSLSSKAGAIGSKTACTVLGNAFKETIGNGSHHLSAQLYFSQLKESLKSKRIGKLACIINKKPCVTFEDIAGNVYAKEVLRETFVLPQYMPALFKGKLRPWRSVLLYGPPGVGKTMLAQALCSHVQATCFWVSVSDITSKYVGESERLLRGLFELAREHSPAIILIDEMDSLGRKRSGSESETERRIKTQFLRQMDSLRYSFQDDESRVSVLATTNMPWELDIAALRRFERKILVPMPNKEIRGNIIKLHSRENVLLSEEELVNLSELTEGYSGSDLSMVVNDALMRPVKELQKATHFKYVAKSEMMEENKMSLSQNSGSSQSEHFVWMHCSPKDAESVEKSVCSMNHEQIYVRPPHFVDFKKSVQNVKPTVYPNLIELYHKFMSKYGEGEQKKQEPSHRAKPYLASIYA